MKYRLFYCVLWMWCLAVAVAVAGQKTWQQLPPLPFDGTISNIAVNDEGVLYIGAGDYVYTSADNGATWTMIGEDDIWGGVTDIATFPGRPGVVVVGTATGISWSMNGGKSWNRDRFEVNPHTGAGGGAGNIRAHVESGRIFAGRYIMSLSGGWQRTHPDKYTSEYTFLPGGTVLALSGNYTEAEVMSSDNGGLSWNTIAALPGLGRMFVDGGGRVYAFVEHYETDGENLIRTYPVLTSDDRGVTWTEFTVGTAGLPGDNPRVELLWIDPATNNVYAKLNDPQHFYGRGVYISVDGMNTWALLDPALEHVRVHEMVRLEDGGIVFATDANGVLLYNPQQQPRVQERNSSLVSVDFLDLFSTSSGRLFATGMINSRMRYTDDEGATWHNLSISERNTQIRDMIELPNGDLLLGTIGSEQLGTSPLYRSSDGGTTWQPVGTGIVQDSANWTGVRSFFTDNSGRIYASVENSGLSTPLSLLVSADNGATWQSIDGALGTAVVLPDGTIFTAGMNAMFEPFFRRSTDGGKTWTDVTGPREIGISSQPLLFGDPQGNFYFRHHNQDTLFVSRDNGITWEPFDTEDFSAVYFDGAGNTYFVHSMATVYLMEKGSTERTRIIAGLPFNGGEAAILSMTFGKHNTPYISHSNGRIYKLTEGTSTDIGEPASALAGGTAYPNPFAEQVVIGYTLPRTSDVSLTLFDILGNEVRTVVAPHQGTGNNTLVIDGSGLVPGLYTYRLTAGNLVQTGTVIRK